MRFTWSEAKRRANLKKHRLDFGDAPRVFDGPTFTYPDAGEYAEQRFVTLGMVEGVVVLQAHTETSDAIRIISFRKATRHEQAIFFESI